ncbi:hypothetical protein [Duganella sp. Leaf126]|uniref:hypothetical protein n=1 Tax=Duganella sp. Leaf126 TaxID=1736266 RepID=UPI000ABCC746|nr:hypothetical protein [Duganella sp. Leaf126]
MKSIKYVVLLWMAALCGLAGAQSLNTQFQGWLGKNQHGYYLDGSEWHYCFSNQGGSCGSVGLTTGHSSCHTTGFNIGGKWAIPTRIGGMEINASANRSWTACNIRSETITCSPNKGYKGRAVINFSERYGRLRVTGGDTYLTIDNDCPDKWRADWLGGTSWRCVYVGGTYDTDGYLPEWRGSSCDYERI